jgi:hypothetical protein
MSRESLLTTLARNAVAAALLGLLLFGILPRSDGAFWDYFDAFSLALCFTLLGHYIEVLLLQLPGIDTALGRLVRLAGWFGGGLWCYVVARWLWLQYRRDLAQLPGLVWGGVFLVGLELIIHAGLRMAGRPGFFGSSVVGSRSSD